MRTKTNLSESKDQNVNAHAQRKPVTLAEQVNALDLPASLARLQSTHGNRFVQRLLRSRLIQAKLTISEPGDQFEQEAERVAEQVMRMADPEAAEGATTSEESQAPQIQRMCSQCDQEIHRQPLEEEEEEETRRAPLMLQRVCNECEEELHRKLDDYGVGEPSNDPEPLVNDVLSSSGRSLDSEARDFFEPRFGRDFSAVQVHTDVAAAESALAVSARAYTFGHHIVFGEGQYSPATDAGRRLLAHELTHVVQQAPQTVARKPVRRRSDSESPSTIRTRPEAGNADAEVQLKTEDTLPSVNRLSVQPTIQRDFVIRPPHPEAMGRVLTPQQMADAITFNNRVVGAAGAGVIGQIRSLLGTGTEPAVVDEDFVNMIVRWQAMQGLTQDGQLGPVTAAPLFRELGAEGAGECKVKSGASYTPGGTIAATIAGANSSATFRLNAEFENDAATHAFPSCCEVRQFIRWNAAAAAAFPAGGIPHAGFPAGTPADTFIEDRDGTDTLRYGHRSGPHAAPQDGNEYLDSTGARNQAFGHIYSGRDTPNGPTAVLAGQWRFYIKVIDVCNRGIRVGGDEVIRINW